jgi:hypothetical protein
MHQVGPRAGPRGDNVPDTQELAASVGRWKKRTVAALLFSVVAAGAAGAAAYLAFRQARQLAQTQRDLAASKPATPSTGLASELGDQRQKTADAEQRAAQAQLQAEKYHLAIANDDARVAETYRELSELTTPRTLTPDLRAMLADKMKPYAGTQFDVALNPDTETQTFLLQLEDALAAAGWKEIDWVGAKPTLTRDKHRVAGVVPLSGVVVQMRADQVAKLKPAADALAAALQLEGIAASAELGQGIKNDNAAALHILVGNKPLPKVNAQN